MRRSAAALVTAAAVLAAPAARAADTPSSLAVAATNAIFKGRFDAAWKLLDPRQRAVATRTRFARCHARDLSAMGRLHILRVDAVTTKTGTAVFPPLGRIPVAVVAVQITYTAPSVSGTQVGTNTAYFTRANGRWYGLLSPASYRAFKAGRCP